MRIHGMRNWRALLAMAAALAASGCDSFLDVNTNPNAPETARIDLRLPGLIGAFVHSTYYGETMLWGSEWTQQFSYNSGTRSYAEVHRYELQDTDGTSAWDYMYAGPLNEANNIMKEATAENDIVYRGLSKFFYAWIYAHIADMWGPAPMAEAFNTSIREPKYDEQKVIYENVHRLLGEAITEMGNTAGRRPAANDLLFAGDMTRWVKLARYVQARHQLRLAYAPGEDKVARANLALTAIGAAFTSNADDADFTYPGGADARNPLWTFQDLGNDLLVASEFMVELLRRRNDPRMPIMVMPIFFDSARGTTRWVAPPNKFRGHRNGASTEPDSTISWVGRYYTNEAASLSVASFSDQKFTEAEARLITSGPAAADVAYRAGIRAHMQKLGVATAAIDAYLAARPALTAANALEEIITEKYIANYLKVEPWNDWRRTGFPRLTIVEQAMLPGIPQRVRTPGSELTNNRVQVTATGIPTGLEGMSVKVWWATTGPR